MVKMLIIGHIGADASTNTVNGKTVINFNVAHSEKYRNAQGQDQTTTIWASCAWWTDKLNIVPYLRKGTQVYVEGQPTARAYLDKQNQAVATLVLRVSSVQLLGSKDGNAAPAQGGAQTYAPSQASAPAAYPTLPGDGPIDDLPF